MTAVDVDALDKLREALAVSLATHRLITPRQCHCGEREPYDERDAGFHRPEWHIAHALAALLPVVDRIANERAAAELRAAAREDYLTLKPNAPEIAPRTYVPTGDLYARADALDGVHPCSGRFCRTCADEATS